MVLCHLCKNWLMKLKCPLLQNMPSKKSQQNYWSFHPSEPFAITHFNVRHPVHKLDFKLSGTYQTLVKVFSVLFQSIFVTYLSLQSTKNISEWLTVGKFFSFFGIVWLPVIGVFTWKNNNRNITENNRRMQKKKTSKLERDFYLKAQY